MCVKEKWTKEGRNERCLTVSWDPFTRMSGRVMPNVFDSIESVRCTRSIFGAKRGQVPMVHRFVEFVRRANEQVQCQWDGYVERGLVDILTIIGMIGH